MGDKVPPLEGSNPYTPDYAAAGKPVVSYDGDAETMAKIARGELSPKDLPGTQGTLSEGLVVDYHKTEGKKGMTLLRLHCLHSAPQSDSQVLQTDATLPCSSCCSKLCPAGHMPGIRWMRLVCPNLLQLMHNL